MLAYYVEWHMRQALKPILQSLIEHVEDAMTVLLVRSSVEMSCLKGNAMINGCAGAAVRMSTI
jgi:hypothetical protein